MSRPASHPLAGRLDSVPDSPGVYRFYGDDHSLLYIGKSIHLRQRITTHLAAGNKDRRAKKLQSMVTDFDWTETAGELGALLMESREIKEKKPLFNRQLRRHRSLWSYQLAANQDGIEGISITMQPEPGLATQNLYGLFTRKSAAKDRLAQLAGEWELCKNYLGDGHGKRRNTNKKTPCFAYQLKKCRGVCANQESIDAYNSRVRQALSGLELCSWPFDSPAVIEETYEGQDLDNISQAFHLFDQWVYFGNTTQPQDLPALAGNPEQQTFDRDTYRLLNQYIHLAKPLNDYL